MFIDISEFLLTSAMIVSLCSTGITTRFWRLGRRWTSASAVPSVFDARVAPAVAAAVRGVAERGPQHEN
ncbi:MAG: hypothetical protein EOP32_12715 [Rhodococcus sp. (in: high G+C Gram-positive bacteria)]|nr:MAG: hypothetical protein EOP32_12715 [Rhodococcus sp. (in: high G+C Gram-positive bacteria)]